LQQPCRHQLCKQRRHRPAWAAHCTQVQLPVWPHTRRQLPAANSEASKT
jgi:hypothetical protein